MKRVVVTGMGAITPVGLDVPAFWENTVAGRHGIAPITRFDTTGSKFTLAAEVKDFDPFERLDRNIARKTDRFTQFALCAAEEAMNDSGLLGHVDLTRLGVYFGSGIGGFETFCEEHQAMLEKGARRVTPAFISKMIANIGAGNIAIRYHATGPCMSVATACATGTTAIGEAYRAIAHGYADAMICGGSEAAITPLAVAGFGNCLALSASADPDAASLPFDKRRAGFIMGEGAGALILEEYEHAAARGAKIYAEVSGYGSTCDAHHVTAPDPEATAIVRAIQDALGNADVPADKIYMNAHGTGTALNDTTETTALKKVFGDAAYALHISSTKAVTGHMLGAAGAVEAIAASLALRDNLVPPTANLHEPDEACDLNYTPLEAAHTPLELAMSESLGFGGHNACVAFKRV